MNNRFAALERYNPPRRAYGPENAKSPTLQNKHALKKNRVTRKHVKRTGDRDRRRAPVPTNSKSPVVEDQKAGGKKAFARKQRVKRKGNWRHSPRKKRSGGDSKRPPGTTKVIAEAAEDDLNDSPLVVVEERSSLPIERSRRLVRHKGGENDLGFLHFPIPKAGIFLPRSSNQSFSKSGGQL